MTTSGIVRSARGPRSMRVLALLVIPLALWSCSLLRMRPTTDYSYPAVRSLAPIQDRLQAADAASPNVLLTDLGQVSTHGFEAPFWRVVYRPFQPGLKRVLVIAGVNGNGAAGVECALGLARELATPPGPATLYDADILPLANPWGWVHGVGASPNGVDIEWDLANFASHESRIIRRFLREKRYDLVIDLRENLEATGFYIWQYGLDSTAVSERIVGDLRAKCAAREARGRGGDVVLGRVDRAHVAGARTLEDRLGERTGATAHVEPGRTLDREPIDEVTGDEPTPTPHVALVAITVRPDVGHRSASISSRRETSGNG